MCIRDRLYVDRILIAASVTASLGSSMQDLASYLSTSGSAGDSSSFNISADFAHGVVYLTNGVPSDADRDRLFHYHRLKP
jgi:hypothetical protein